MKTYDFIYEIHRDLNHEVGLKDVSFIIYSLIREITYDLVNHVKFEVHGLGEIYCKTINPVLRINQPTIGSNIEAVKLTKGKNLMFLNLSKEIRDFLKEAGGYGKTED